MKNLVFLLLSILSTVVYAGGHDPSQEHGGKPAAESEHAGSTADAREHGGKPAAESDEDDGKESSDESE